MDELFLGLWNRSVTTCWLILAVVLLRLLLKKAPKSVCCLLWAMVGVRLLCPFSIESALSLIPSAEIIQPAYLDRSTLQISTGITAANSMINDYLGDHYFEGVTAQPNLLERTVSTAGVLWLLGLAAMAVWALWSWRRLRRQVAEAVPEGEGVYLCEGIGSPFVLGLLKPKIYLPAGLSPVDTAHVVAHERSHLRRRDHWWKPLGFLVLAVHWFNPLAWLSYVLLCRDIEMACDEAVVRDLEEDGRADYSRALLRCACRQRAVAVCPLAFGEVGVKQRIKSVLSYKRPAFWIVLASLALCAVVAVCFLTDPRDGADQLPEEVSVDPIPSPVQSVTTDPATGTDYVTLSNPLSSAFPVTYTDGGVVERVYEMYQGLTWEVEPSASFDTQTWLSVELVRGGARYSLLIDRNGVGVVDEADPEEVSHLRFDPDTYDFEYLWRLYTRGSDAAQAHIPVYTGGALLYMGMALSFMPTDGSGYANVMDWGDVLTIQDDTGALFFTGRPRAEADYSRERFLEECLDFWYGQISLEALVPETVETVTARVYESEDGARMFTVWRLAHRSGEVWLWLGEGGLQPLRLYELIDRDEAFDLGARGFFWTYTPSHSLLPLRFEGEFTSVEIAAGTGFLTLERTESGEETVTLAPGETVYWVVAEGEEPPERAVLSYEMTREDGSSYEDRVELRALSRSESLFGGVTYGVSQDWLGYASSFAHLTGLTAEEGTLVVSQPTMHPTPGT